MDQRIVQLYRSLTSGEGHHPVLVPIRAVVRWTVVFYRQLERDRAFIRAAGMGYITLIALIPALLLVFGVLGATGLLQDNQRALETLVFDTFLGDVPEVTETLLPGLMQVDLGALGLVGVLGLMVVVARLYLMVERAYCDIFGVPVERALPSRLMNFYFTLTAVPVAILASSVAASSLADEIGFAWIRSLLGYLLPFLVVFAALKLFPATRVRWRAALLGSVVTWVLLMAGGQLFPLYIRLFASDNPLRLIYGSLGLLPVFLLWLYLLWIFVLLGAEVAYVAQNYRSLLQAELDQLEHSRSPLRAPSLETALELSVWVGWHFDRARGAVETETLAEQSGMRARDVRQVLGVLEEMDLVARTDAGWLLTRPTSDVALVEVAEGWRSRTTLRRKRGDPVGTLVSEALASALEGTLEEAIERWIRESDEGEVTVEVPAREE